MKLTLSTQQLLRAMLRHVTRAEVLERCDVPEYTLTAALRGDDLPSWEAEAITDAVEAWDGGADE